MKPATHTMTPEEQEAWRKRHHDPRSTRDRYCSRCDTPITRYSRSGLCRACAYGGGTCTRCNRSARRGESVCGRCRMHESIPLRKQATHPTPAQRERYTRAARLQSTFKRATPLKDGECVHIWAIPELPTNAKEHSYDTVCRLCGAEKTLRPFAAEDAVRAKVAQGRAG